MRVFSSSVTVLLCSPLLYGVLPGLPPAALLALCRLVTETESGEQLISKVRP